MTTYRWAALGAIVPLLTWASSASAQTAPHPPPGFEQQQGQPQPQQPPPGYYPGQPPPGYYPPPPGYYAPPGYGQPQVVAPKQMDYTEGQPVPAGYHVESHIRKGLVAGGLATFGALYLLSIVTAAVAHDTNNGTKFDPLYAPAVGPFITIGTSSASASGALILVLDGVGQCAGIAMTIGGFLADVTVLERNDASAKKFIRPTPMRVGKDGTGFGVIGTF